MSMKSAAIVSLFCATGLACGMALASNPNPNPEWDDQWPTLESEFLSGHVQLTSEAKYIKAGESYFSPDGRMVIFQAIEIPAEGEEAGAHYAMYVASVQYDDDRNIIGLGQAGMVSAGNGSANTCGWFHPTDPMRILFGTTITAPSNKDVVGFQRKTSKYSWKFPTEMDIVAGDLSMTYVLSDEATARATKLVEEDPTATPELSMNDIISVPTIKNASPVWEREGYDAEGSWSPDGRYILYTQLEPGSNNGDIWIYDSTDGSHLALITADGYDGGPFFSPDGQSICYRSDRRGDNMLQIFVAALQFDESGKVNGAIETQLTDNEHVNWCPFYTPDGKYLLYATSEQSHGNYEIYAIDSSGEYSMEETPRMRVSQARGFDGLPAFTSDGEWMIWTAQRGATRDGEERPSSQLWAAKVNLDAIDKAYQAQRKAILDKNEADAFENYMPED
ncbi:hypothetical protein COB72_05970 [bacterium]|nr:MAG: hypothetical protein COB72_05970 [bacterium]